jgi:hypothetical protein
MSALKVDMDIMASIAVSPIGIYVETIKTDVIFFNQYYTS